MKKRFLVSLLLAVVLMVSIPVATFANTGNTTPVLSIESKNLSLKDNVQPVFDVYYENVNAADVTLLLWTAAQTDYTVGTAAVTLDPYTVDADTLRFYYTDLTAKQMTDNLYIRAYAEKDGKAYYGDLTKFSVLEYAYTKLGNIGNDATEDENLKTLLNEMLEYGAAAQTYFGYNTNRLATADFYQVSVVGTTLADGTTAGLYVKDDQITLTAPAQNAEGKLFSAWLVNGEIVSNEKTYTLTVPEENVVCEAAYGGLVAVNVVNGALEDGSTNANVYVGSTITLSAKTAANGYTFKYWKDTEGNVVGEDRISTVPVTGATTYKAYYELTFGELAGTQVCTDLTKDWQQGGFNGDFTAFNVGSTATSHRVSLAEPLLLPAGSSVSVYLPIAITDATKCPWETDGSASTTAACKSGCRLTATCVVMTKNENGATDSDIVPGYTILSKSWKSNGFKYTAPEDQDVYLMITTKYDVHGSVAFNLTDNAEVMSKVKISLIPAGTEIPAGTYWEAELTDGIEKIEDIRKTLGTEGLSEFFFLADSHWNDNEQYSPALINYLAEKLKADTVIFGGDIIVKYHALKEDAINQEIVEFYTAMMGYTEVGETLKVFTTLGNHDRNGSSNQPDATQRLTEAEAYYYYTKMSESFAITYENDSSRSYFDDEANKVRYIQFYFTGSLNGMTEDKLVDAGLAWAEEKIMELKEDWTVVLLTHGVFNGSEGSEKEYTTKDDEVIKRILKLQGEADAEIAIWINGHIHEDRNVIASDDYGNQVRIVSLNCDARGNSNSATSYEMVAGETSEQSFSFIQVDTNNQMIYLTRFGAGGDLVYGYGENIGESTSADVDEKVFHETIPIRVHNGTANGKSYLEVDKNSQVTLVALEVAGHTFSYWTDKNGTNIGSTATLTITATEANTYRPVYTAQENYKNVANDWFNGGYDGKMIDWVGESHTVTNPTRVTSKIFELKPGETITLAYQTAITMTNGNTNTLSSAYALLQKVEGSNTGDIFTDYKTTVIGKDANGNDMYCKWAKTYTNSSDETVLIVFMFKPADGNGGFNLSNPAMQTVSVSVVGADAEQVNIRIHNGTSNGSTYVTTTAGQPLTITALEITGHTFSHWVDKTGATVATTATATVLPTEHNTYRPVYIAQEGYTAVANEWIQGSYNGSMTAWAGEGHTVDSGSNKCTRITSNVITLKAGETISVTRPTTITATDGLSATTAVAIGLATKVEGSDTGDIYTDYSVSYLPDKTTLWMINYTNNTDSDIQVIIMIKTDTRSDTKVVPGWNLSNPASQEITVTIS